MEKNISPQDELNRLREECNRLRKERDCYHSEIQDKSLEISKLTTTEIGNYCNNLKEKIWEEFYKKIARAFGIAAIIVSIVGATSFFSLKTLLDLEIKNLGREIETKVDEKIDSEIGEKKESIQKITDQMFVSIANAQQKITNQLSLLKFNLDRLSRDALIYAIREGKTDVVRMLLDIGTDPNAKDPLGNPVICLATIRKNIDIVNYLLKNGANANDRDRNDRTSLIHAAEHGFTDIVQSLLKNGADKNVRGYAEHDFGATALIVAAKNGRCDVIRLLKDEGVDLYIEDENKKTAISWAEEKNYKEIVVLLKN